ncbi:replication initiator protein [Sigmofec virus UA08Rod_5594]|uniref:Replication initiator protein n=1 Tax=Sigmofec virus UA08Rod_5594 TaxID=2929430 RepID=A0A976R800_9VIRU|nr:replication initiator protein [Sigmofec virus UA08Rod_5594]
MSCYHPKYGVLVPTPDGSRKLKFAGVGRPQSYTPDVITVPCGQCIGCRVDYARQWAARCMLEMQYHDETWFVTLTYDPEHVPHSQVPGCESILTCRTRDVQLWLKRLRKSGQIIRYFGASDYGAQTLRPHYHFILFGLQVLDLEPYEQADIHYKYWSSPSMTALWGLGDVILAPANYSTCLYTSKYICSKRKGQDADLYDSYGMDPPRSYMSRRPGIGYQYYVDHPDLLDYSYISVPSTERGVRLYPPRYFRQLSKLADPDEYERRSSNYSVDQYLRISSVLSRTSVPYEQLLSADERRASSDFKFHNIL